MGHAARFPGRAGSAQHVCCYVLQTEEMDDSAARRAHPAPFFASAKSYKIKPIGNDPHFILLKVTLNDTLVF